MDKRNKKRIIIGLVIVVCIIIEIAGIKGYKKFVQKRMDSDFAWSEIVAGRYDKHVGKWDVDNDGYDEYVVCDQKYYPIRVYDAKNRHVKVVFEGTGPTNVLSLYRYNGVNMICYSNTVNPGYQSHHFMVYVEDRLMKEFYLEAMDKHSVYELLDEDSIYRYMGEEITMSEYKEIEQQYKEKYLITPPGYDVVAMDWESYPKYLEEKKENERKQATLAAEHVNTAYAEFVKSNSRSDNPDERKKAFEDFLFGDAKALQDAKWMTFEEISDWAMEIDHYEYKDIDNDSEEELLVHSPDFYTTYIYDIDEDGRIFFLDGGEGTAGYISYTEVNGETLIVHSDIGHSGRQIHRFSKYENGRKVDEFYLNAEYWDNPNDCYDEKSKFIYRGREISMRDYERLMKHYLTSNEDS